MIRRGRVAAVALAVVAACALPGCAVLRGGVVSETTSCAAVIPLANQIVSDRGQLKGIRALRRKDTRTLLETGVLHRARSGPLKPPRKACLLVYQGRFGQRGGRARRYLVLLIGVLHPKLLGSATVDKLSPAIRRYT